MQKTKTLLDGPVQQTTLKLVSSECALRKFALVSVADLKTCTGSMGVVR